MSEFIEIRNYEGKGYQPLASFEKWRVAVLRHLEETDPGNLDRMERHMQTDEVFILVRGAAILLAGGSEKTPANIEACPMSPGVVYNVKKSVWHTCSLSRDAHVIIIENDDTGKANSEYAVLGNGDRLKAQNDAARWMAKQKE